MFVTLQQNSILVNITMRLLPNPQTCLSQHRYGRQSEILILRRCGPDELCCSRNHHRRGFEYFGRCLFCLSVCGHIFVIGILSQLCKMRSQNVIKMKCEPNASYAKSDQGNKACVFWGAVAIFPFLTPLHLAPLLGPHPSANSLKLCPQTDKRLPKSSNCLLW